ncbi:MAG: steroid 3-ketoacyl-CoA thiolase [Acidimicrobiales bacterium]|jgi:acetyl-CoA C-acetyltransferase|nr:steroid 3-ketoacyl-CoA thiolase [Acidimicrobiales bacterium]
MREVVIVEAVRTAVGKRNGSLAHTHPTDLLGPVQMEAVRRAGISPSDVGQVIGGCIDQVGAQAANVTRTSWLTYGGDIATPAMTIDVQCGSSQQAVTLAYNLIMSGSEDVVLACGVENMSMVPIGANAADGAKAGHGKPVTRKYWEQHEFTSQFEGAERIATKYGISRADTDGLGLESQRRARVAVDEGRFETQILPIEAAVVDEHGEKTGETKVFSVDEVLRDTSLEALANLKPVAREDGVHTAGSSSQIADGAAAVLLMSSEKAAELGLRPRARILSAVLVGCDPVLMLEGPIPATEKMLAETGLTMHDIDVVEINEAFASVVLAWAKAVGADMDKVNPNGGAIALGHPLGGTGCILTTKALHELERTDGRYGLITMCCGGGLGTGTIIQRL